MRRLAPPSFLTDDAADSRRVKCTTERWSQQQSLITRHYWALIHSLTGHW